MYNPIQKGIDKSAKQVRYTEVEPPADLVQFVHRFWEIKSESKLLEDFAFHVLPDACIHLVFNLCVPNSAGLSALRTAAEELNLGQEFHFVGVRLLPGVWQGRLDQLSYGFIDAPYRGCLPLADVSQQMVGQEFAAICMCLADLVRRLIQEALLIYDEVTTSLLANIDEIDSVRDMAYTAGLSPRQLQRVLRQTTGFTPHDFLKVLRLQKSFVQGYHDFYTDQAHFIHSFRKMTGYTPKKYASKFDVRFLQYKQP